jgi:hypothetical protein
VPTLAAYDNHARPLFSILVHLFGTAPGPESEEID